jgi:polyisoprenoid-binding protein YceI
VSVRNRCLQCLTLAVGSLFLVYSAVAQPPEFNFDKFDRNHSTIGFRVPILGGMSSVEGKFTAFDVQLRYVPADPSKGLVGATIDAASISTGIAERDVHLKSADFLNVAAHPRIMFISKKVEGSADGLVIHGTLSMRGVSKPVDLTARVNGTHRDSASGDYLIGLHAATTINRRDFGVAWTHPDPLFVGDSVYIEIDLISKLTPVK